MPHIKDLLRPSRQLTQEQVLFLIDKERLREKLYWTLAERVEEFNRKWPKIKFTNYRLRKLFEEHRITRRTLTVGIELNDN